MLSPKTRGHDILSKVIKCVRISEVENSLLSGYISQNLLRDDDVIIPEISNENLIDTDAYRQFDQEKTCSTMRDLKSPLIMNPQTIQFLTTLSNEIQSVRYELQVIRQQQSQTDQLVQQQQTQISQLTTCLALPNNAVAIQSSLHLPALAAYNTNVPDQFLPALETPSPLGTPSSLGILEGAPISGNTDLGVEIRRPEASYPSTVREIGQNPSGPRRSHVSLGVSTERRHPKRVKKSKRSEKTSKKDEAKESVKEGKDSTNAVNS